MKPGRGLSTPADKTARRAARLLRWYPPCWRARYGAEFVELLLAEFAEQPDSWRRTADIIGSGLLARCSRAGLTGHGLPPAEQIQSGIATLWCALAAFLAFGVAMLTQLATGWQWASPRSASAAGGTVAMSVAAACLFLIALAAAVPVAWCAAVAVGRRDGRLARPAVLTLGCAAALVSGARHFQNGWPGTGGTGVQHGLVPGGVAAFGWASTLSVSSFWAHPALLGVFPVAELAWMIVSPVAGIGLVAGLATVVRRLALPSGLLRYLARLAVAASAAAVPFLAGAASWVLGTGPGQAALFRPGLVDGADLMIMALALMVALRAASGIRRVLTAGTAPAGLASPVAGRTP
jgi:hypothetical protein